MPPFGRDATGLADPDEEPIVVEIALPADATGPSITDVWSALGVAPGASLDLHAITRVRGGEAIAGPPVEHLVLDVERLDTAGVLEAREQRRRSCGSGRRRRLKSTSLRSSTSG